MRDGIYFDLPDEVYHRERRLSSSSIRDILESPTHYWFNSNLNPLREERSSEAMADGRLLHAMILETENFYQKYKITPPEIDLLNKNSSEYRLWKAAQTQEIITYAKYRKFKLICDYLREPHQLLDSSVFCDGYPEVSFFWTEGEIKRKARVDYLKKNTITDLKTFVKMKKNSLENYVAQYFFSFKVYLQLIYYHRAVAFAKANNLPVTGTSEQKKFWAEVGEDLLLSVAFVNREIPQTAVKYFLKEKCPDLWTLGENQIKKAEAEYVRYSTEYGLKSAWLPFENVTANDLTFADTDFPQSFYEILQGDMI